MFESLPGFREFYPERCAVRNHLFRLWKQVALSYGFSEYDAPLLEPLELYIRKSGEEIVGQLFNFTDKGGREVALRPELTPSLARLVGAKASSLKKPVKWFCIGENFRYERPGKGRTRSHYQLNADILGESSPAADAELIALCLNALTVFGLSHEDIVLRLSDRDLWIDYLAGLGIEGDQALEVLGIIDKMERVDRDATLEQLQPHFSGAAEDFLTKLDTLVQLRTLGEVQDFLLGHTPHADIKKRLEARLAEWGMLLDSLGAMGLMPFIQIDLGIVRGLAYYTGFVFEIFSKRGKSRALAGGGRYDHLVEKLGYTAMSAVGFGMGDVTLTDLLEERKLLPGFVTAPDLYVIIGGDEERKAALSDISQLRASGFSVDYPLKQIGFGKQFKLANQAGSRLAVIYGSEELATDSVKVRDLAEGLETLIPRGKLLPALHDMINR